MKSEKKNKEFPTENLAFRLDQKLISRLKILFYKALFQEIQRQVNLTQSVSTTKELKEFCEGFYCTVVDVGSKQRIQITTDWVVDNDVMNDPNLDLKSRAKVLPLALPKQKKVLILSVPRSFKDVWVHSNIAESSFVHRALNKAFSLLFKEKGSEILQKAFQDYERK